MANRFIRGIENGEIATEGELKSAFRALALATHPDLGEAGARGDAGTSGETFMKARAEYEAALRYIAPGAGARAGRAFERAVFYADVAALLKAGFPKTPRHDKERSKYARLRLRVRSALEEPAREAFDSFERESLALRESGREGDGAVVDGIRALLEELVEYEECGIVPLRAAIEIEFASLASSPLIGDGVLRFMRFMVSDMHGGPALG